MFHKNLAVSAEGDVGTPGLAMTPSVATPAAATPGLTSSVMSPAMTPAAMTPSYSEAMLGGAAMTPREGSGYFSTAAENAEAAERGDEQDEEPEDEQEKEVDLIKRLTMQNLFTPANASASLGSKYVTWAEMPSPAPTQPATPQTPATVHELETPGPARLGDGMSEMAFLQHKYGATKPMVHNVVATASLGCELNLKQIAMTARNAEYNPRRFAAVIMKIRDPKSTALVFKSGKLVVTGTKSEEEARHAARKFGRVIMKVGYSAARFKDFRVENLVSTFNVPFPIHLERLYKSLPSTMHSQYEPEVFPGLICKAPGGTLLIFVSGKCVMIGMKTREDIEKAYKFILPKLEEHRKK